MKPKAKLFVEGLDDLHVVAALLQHHEVPETFAIEEKGGIDQIFKVLPVQLKGSEVSAVGVLVDADENALTRWTAIASILSRAGYTDLPVQPPAEGLILRAEGLPDFGTWLMPDNEVSGMLEDFVAHLVPANDDLWLLATAAVDQIPRTSRRFKAQHLCKVHIHTWLAWQEDPGTPMGLSITKKYLDPASENCGPFLNWINSLFGGAAKAAAA